MLSTGESLRRVRGRVRPWLITVSIRSEETWEELLIIVALNHVYCDPFDHFEYKVTLTRVNIGGRVQVEKYTCYVCLSLLQTNSLTLLF